MTHTLLRIPIILFVLLWPDVSYAQTASSHKEDASRLDLSNSNLFKTSDQAEDEELLLYRDRNYPLFITQPRKNPNASPLLCRRWIPNFPNKKLISKEKLQYSRFSIAISTKNVQTNYIP